MAKSKYAHSRVEVLPVESLKDAPYNARVITAEALRGLATSLEEFGLLAFPVVNKRGKGYRLIGGHQRVEILRRQGVTETACVVVEIDDATERQANFALNNPAIQGEFVPELTRSLLADIHAALTTKESAGLFSDLKMDNLMKAVSRAITLPNREEPRTGKTADNATVSLPRTKAVSKPGAYYRLGDHILCCGMPSPASAPPHMEKVADLGVTRVTVTGEPTDDYLDALLLPLLKASNGWAYAHVPYHLHARVVARVNALHGIQSSLLVWINDNGTPEEPYQSAVVSSAVYFRKEGAPRQWFGAKGLGTVFNAERLGRDLPVSCYTDIFLNSAKKGDMVLDTNVAGGASVIAAEKLGLHLRGYVWTPRDMDVVRRRWSLYVHGEGANPAAVAPEISL